MLKRLYRYNKNIPHTNIMETKKCTNPNCELYGIEQPITEFEFRKDTNKYRNHCNTCQRKASAKRQATYRKKHNIKYDNAYNKTPQRKKYQKEYSKKYRKLPAKYDLWNDRISFCEETRRDPDNPELIQVRCKKCKEWMNPTNEQIRTRSEAINDAWYNTGNNFFYCSELCKSLCPVYKKIEFPEGEASSINLDNAIPQTLRDFVFDRDKNECQKCGEHEKLECHHIVPRKVNKCFSLDPDNCITLCHDCHVWVHSQLPGCTYQELREYKNEDNK